MDACKNIVKPAHTFYFISCQWPDSFCDETADLLQCFMKLIGEPHRTGSCLTNLNDETIGTGKQKGK